MNEYRILLTWDEEARVWIAESDDIPGLILESGSPDALIERVRYAAPELLELSGNMADVSLSFRAERHAATMSGTASGR
jgi:predicted RNase H-like HicB family nuclease